MPVDKPPETIIEPPVDPGRHAGVGMDHFRDEPVKRQGALQADVTGRIQKMRHFLPFDPVHIPRKGVQAVSEPYQISLFDPKGELAIVHLEPMDRQVLPGKHRGVHGRCQVMIFHKLIIIDKFMKCQQVV